MNVRMKFDHWIPKLLGVDAIVLFPFMLFASKLNDVPDRTLTHEWHHVEQIREAGALRFYASYLLFYFAYRVAGESHYGAYMEIPWEVEARAVEAHYHS